MRTIKLTLMYDGTNYAGWQIQKNAVTIQELLQDGLRQMTGEKTKVVGASRTDAGVHALGQIAHFKTSTDITCDGFRNGLNSMLPADIAVIGVSELHETFHARKDAKAKNYLYRILVARDRYPFLLNRCWHLRKIPDIDAMRKAAGLLIGKHDYSSFRAAGCTARDTIRTIDTIEIYTRPFVKGGAGWGRPEDLLPPDLPLTKGESSGTFIDFHFTGNGFLRHMVRNIVGTLVDIGLEKIGIDTIPLILSARDRKKAGRSAPACGLYLVEVVYG